MLDQVLFVALPYAAVVLAVAVGVHRYRSDRYSHTSLSSQFLDRGGLFWGSVPWHYGILPVLAAHLLAALFPRAWAALLGAPARLQALEATGVALALYALVGLVLLVARRVGSPRLRVVTTAGDWALLVTLLAQVALGLHVAVSYRWGGEWFVSTVAPWLWSLVRLQPDVAAVSALPWAVKAHVALGFVIIGMFPFTRLVHALSIPVAYLWREPQVVVWARDEHPGGER